MIRMITVCLLFAAILSGCSSSEEGCNGETAKSTLSSLMKENAADSLNNLVKKSDSYILKDVLTVAKVKSSIDAIQVSFSDVITKENDTKSAKKTCSATMQIVLPNSVSSDLKHLVDGIENSLGIENIIDSQSVKFDGSRITLDVDYSVTPTDDGKKLFVEVAGAKRPINLIWYVSLLDLGKEYLAAFEESEQKRQIAYAEAQYHDKAVEAEKSRDEANNAINAIWQGTSKEFRASMLPEQKAWLKKRSVDCRVKEQSISKGAKEGEAAIEGEIAKLQCEEEMTLERTKYLEEKVKAYQVQPTPQN